MVLTIKDAFDAEMAGARDAYIKADYDTAFNRLKRAHILGQRNFLHHWSTHWWMLKLGLRIQDKREVVGQIIRLVAVIPGFVFGWVPVGNTGAAEVSALKPMPLSEDLKSVLGKFSVWNDVLQRAALGLVVVILILALR